MANVGNCPKCKQPNEYSKIVCDFCGARLPWADAVQTSKREADAAAAAAAAAARVAASRPTGPVPPQPMQGGQPMALPPQGQMPPGQMPPGQMAPGQMPPGQVPPGYAPPPQGYPQQGYPTQQSPQPYPPGYAPPAGGMPAPMPMQPPVNGQICERCGFIGNPVSQTPGSFAVEFALWFFFCLPGLIYSLWRLTSRKSVCPRCQGGMLPLNTPGGAALYARFFSGQAHY